MNIHPDVLASHAQFGGDLELMQKAYEWHDLKAEIELIRVDAERYKFLRNNHARVWDGANGFSVDIDFEGKGDNLDEAIDAVLAGYQE